VTGRILLAAAVTQLKGPILLALGVQFAIDAVTEVLETSAPPA
jgi:small neutral amino acid transporter SnatA (MarC family)